ncbi:hypothetical protein GCM10010517_80230 [Streptosporangium fragile]|uniref:Uncharacterized protein n=1 Tax=Streptosporangium fragile TaxID=46186 RepID=A0ABN3WI31_9ACTN
MRKSSAVLAALAGAALVAVSMTAPASAAGTSSGSASGTQILTFRGMSLVIPTSWQVYSDANRVKVITGSCAKPVGGYFTPKCDAFWIFGPTVIKSGHEGFNPYTPDRPFYPASDVQPCPLNGKYGQVLGKATATGLRQVGAGHKAYYRSWAGRCIVEGNGRQIATFNQREWYLPQSKILIVDQWNTPTLATALKYADWK